MSKTEYLVIALVFVIATGVGVFWNARSVSYDEIKTIGQNVPSFKELSDRFQKLAQDKGGEYAFHVLLKAPLPPGTDLHLLGHTVGDVLYKQKGVSGISLCTQDFRNACSHSIVIGALNEFGGDKALVLIRDACQKAPGGSGAYTMCYHGLGHGVFAFYKYDLAKTADFCKKTGTDAYHQREYEQCVGGSVMELIGGGGHDHDAWLLARDRYFTKDPLSPCLSDVIPALAKGDCLTYITPQLFVRAGADLGNPDPKTFPLAFSYCNEVREVALRHACFGGFGKEFIPLVGARDTRNVALYSDEQYHTAGAWCASAKDKTGISDCVQSEVNSLFWGGENDPSASTRFCAAIDAPLQDACYQSLSSNINNYVRDPAQRSRICDMVPPQRRAECIKTSIDGSA